MTIECGGAGSVLSIGDDAVGTATFSGLMVPANFLAIGVMVMKAAVGRGAKGLVYIVGQAAVCCDPVSMTASYPTLAAELRARPVAFVVNAGQADLYAHVVQRAAAAGLIRRTFDREDAARAWLAETLLALELNHAWWTRAAATGGAAPAGPGVEALTNGGPTALMPVTVRPASTTTPRSRRAR